MNARCTNLLHLHLHLELSYKRSNANAQFLTSSLIDISFLDPSNSNSLACADLSHVHVR